MKLRLLLLMGLTSCLSLDSYSLPFSLPRVEWMGSYMNGTKVGYSVCVLGEKHGIPEQFPFDPPDMPENLPGVYHLYSQTTMNVRASHGTHTVKWSISGVLNQDLSVAGFRFLLNSGDTELQMVGTLQGNDLAVEIHSAGDVRKQSFKLEKPLYLAESLPTVLAMKLNQQQPLDGDYLVMEPHEMTTANWQTTLLGQESVLVRNEPHSCWHIQQKIGGLSPEIWMTAEGVVLKEWAPLSEGVGYLSFSETESEASNLGYIHPDVQSFFANQSTSGEVDLLVATAVPVDTDIPRPSTVTRMVVDLWNFDLSHPFPFSPRQKNLCIYHQDTFTEESPLRLEIIRGSVPSEGHAWVADESFHNTYKSWLETEPLVQSDHPEIIELAKELTDKETDPWKKALAIHSWILAHVQTEFRITLPSALEVLRSGKGDCNEQSFLFAALARAAGIPTRICTGLVYQNKSFMYHAWNEVLISADPPTWVPIDAALRQQVIDATHIKFGEGNLADQRYINGLVGKIKVKILEVETAQTR